MAPISRSNKLIGKVAANFLRSRINTDEGQLTFRFDGLQEETLAACVDAIWADPELRAAVLFKIPADLLKVEDAATPDIIFDGTAAEARNIDIPDDKQVLLTANSNDGSNSDTLKDVARIDREALLSNAEEWLKCGGLRESHKEFKKLQTIFTAFMREWNPMLLQAADFLLSITDRMMGDRAENLETALNGSLAILGVPHNAAEIKKRLSKKNCLVRDWESFFKLARSQSRWFKETRPAELTAELLRAHLEAMDTVGLRPEVKAAYEAACEEGTDDNPLSNLIEFDWSADCLKDFIEGAKRKASQTLAQLTLKCFEENANNRLGAEFYGRTVKEFLEKDLSDLVKSRSDDQDLTEAIEFHRYYRDVLESGDSQSSLLKKWDNFLYPDKIECTNIISGILIGARRLLSRKKKQGSRLKLKIRLAMTKTGFYETVNHKVIRYFSLAYKEFFDSFSDIIRWDEPNFKIDSHRNPIFCFDDVREELKISTLIKKQNAASATLKFDLSLDLDSHANKDDKDAIKIVWNFPIKSLPFAFCDDIRFLKEDKKVSSNPLSCIKTYFAFSCRDSNAKGILEEPSLQSLASFSLPNGRLIQKTSSLYLNIDKEIKKSLEKCEASYPGSTASFETAWETFRQVYADTITALAKNDSAYKLASQTYAAYEVVLKSLNSLPKSKTERKTFYSLVVSVGVFSFVDRKGNSFAIVPPWHPLRLKSLFDIQKFQGTFLRRLLSGKDSNLIQEEDYQFQRITRDEFELLDPKVVAIPEKNFAAGTEFSTEYSCSSLLVPKENLAGYTLYGPANSKYSEITERGAIDPIHELVSAMENYIKLMPQESGNLSICLPDARGSSLALAVSKKISALQSKDSGDKWKNFTLHFGDVSEDGNHGLTESLTAELNENSDVEALQMTSSGIYSPLKFFVPPDDQDAVYARPYSLSLITNLGSESARLTWVTRNTEEDTDNRNTDSQYLQHKNVNLEDEESSELLLVPPKQTSAGIELVRAISSLSADDAALQSRDIESGVSYLAPALKAAFVGDIKDRIQEIHRNSDWVVICDSLIDRKMLEANGIGIIRYKKDDKSAGTVIISSTESGDFSKKKLIQKLTDIHEFDQISCVPENADKLAEKLLQRSYQISGYVALRAASEFVNAGELLGLCLSDKINTDEIRRLSEDNGESIVFETTCLLDDYANWFRNIKKRADLLTVIVTEKEGETSPRVHLCVSEAKYCSISSLSSEKKNSEAQIMASLSVFIEGLTQIGNQTNYDRDIWLERLSNLVIELASKKHQNGKFVSSEKFQEISKQILKNNAQLTLHGYSHVFVHDRPDLDNMSSREKIQSDTLNGCPVYQEVYNQGQIIRLLKTFLDSEKFKVRTVREELPGDPLMRKLPLLNNARSFISDLTTEMMESETEEDEPESNSDAVTNDSAEKIQEKKNELTESETPAVSSSNTAGAKTVPAIPTNEAGPTGTAEVTGKPAKKPNTSVTPDPNSHFPHSFTRDLNDKAKESEFSEERKTWCENAGKLLRTTLVEQGIPTNLLGVRPTPNGCLVRLSADIKLNVKAVDKLSDYLLSSQSLEVVYSEAVRGEFHVLLATEKRESVLMWNIWKHRKMNRKGGINFDVAVGLREDDGDILYLNPLEDPHTLVAGTTGSGKTVLVQMMLLDIAATNSSKLTKFYLIDPKGGMDYQPLLRLPHLAHELVTDQTKATEIFESINAEMERRKKVLTEAGCRDIAQFNSRAAKDDRLPVLWVIHDELAAWSADKEYKEAVYALLKKLATQSRAMGIYLIFIAQRPDNEVFPMQVRANIGNRLVLKLNDEETSNIALGQAGAEKLLGKGHMLAKLEGKLVHAQAPFLHDDEDNNEIEQAVDMIIQADKEWDELDI